MTEAGHIDDPHYSSFSQNDKEDITTDTEEYDRIWVQKLDFIKWTMAGNMVTIMNKDDKRQQIMYIFMAAELITLCICKTRKEIIYCSDFRNVHPHNCFIHQ